MRHEGITARHSLKYKVAAFGGAIAIGGLGTAAAKGIESMNVNCEGEEAVTVRGGDTLWEYADEINDGTMYNPAIVEEIRDLNYGLAPSELIDGQVVTLPKSCE